MANFLTFLFGDQTTSALHAAWWQAIAAALSCGAVIILSFKQNELTKEQNKFFEEQQKKENETQERMSMAIRTIVADKLDMISTQILNGVNTGNWKFISEISTFDLPVSIKDLAYILEPDLIQQIHFHLDIAYSIQQVVKIPGAILGKTQLNEFNVNAHKMHALAKAIRVNVELNTEQHSSKV